METLHTEPLTQQAFAAYGNVIETDGAAFSIINGGYTLRFNDLKRFAFDLNRTGIHTGPIV